MATPHRPDDENPGWVIPPPPGTGPQSGGPAVPGYDPNPPGAREPTPAYGTSSYGSGPYGPPPGAPHAGPEQAGPEPYTAPLDARPYAAPAKRRVPRRALIIAGGSVAAALLVGVSAVAVIAANKREYTNVAEDRGGGLPAPAGASSGTPADGTMGTPSPQRTPKAKRSAKPSPSRSGGGGGASRSGRDAPPIPAGFIKDASAGIAYPGKGSPWFRGDQFDDYRSSWTSYVKRKVSSSPDYYAEIGAGRLPSGIAYAGSSSLRSATEAMARKYLGDRGLYPEHELTGVVSAARTVDGRRAWYYSAVLKFPQAAEEGWAWKSERMTLLTVHLPGRRPGTMFTTIPDVLDTSIGANSVSAARVL